MKRYSSRRKKKGRKTQKNILKALRGYNKEKIQQGVSEQ